MGVTLTKALTGPRLGKLLAIEKQNDTTPNRTYTYSGGMQAGLTTTDITILRNNTSVEIKCFVPCVAFQNATGYDDESSYSIGITEVQYSTDSGSNWVSLGWVRCGSQEDTYTFTLKTMTIFLDGLDAGTLKLRYRHGAYNHADTILEKFVVNNIGIRPYASAFGSTVEYNYSTTAYYSHFIVLQYDGADDVTYPEGSYSSISRRMSEEDPGIDLEYGFSLPTTISSCYTNGLSPTVTAYTTPFENVYFINDRGCFITFPEITKTANAGLFAEIRVMAGCNIASVFGIPAFGLCFAVEYSTDGGGVWNSYGITPYTGQYWDNGTTRDVRKCHDNYTLPVLLSSFASTTVQFRVEVRGTISDNTPLTDSIKYVAGGSCYAINRSVSAGDMGNCGTSISYVELDI